VLSWGGSGDEELDIPNTTAFKDLTDGQNPNFVYVIKLERGVNVQVVDHRKL